LWLGYDKPLNMKGSSSDLAAPLWGWWMHSMHQDLDVPKKFTGLATKAKYVCGVSGKYRNGTCKTMPIPTVSGQKPRGRCTENHPAPDPNKKYNSVWQRRGLQ